MSDYDKIYADFVGKDKVQAISVKLADDGAWELKYRENHKVCRLNCDSREDLEKILIEFGGKNPETCKANNRFLEIKNWGSEDLDRLGHRITKIALNGLKLSRVKSIPFTLPDKTGHKSAIQSKRQNDNDITLRMKDREEVTFTRSFSSGEEFDTLINYIKTHGALNDLSWYVKLIGTESKETKEHCVWKRVMAGDGTKRMVLELREINGKDFRDCVRQDVFNAAGDMFDSPCQRIAIRKKQTAEKNICGFAVGDGKVDIAGYEAAK